MNKNVFRSIIVLTVLVLFAAACGKKPAPKQTAAAQPQQPVVTSQQCMEKSVFGLDNFQNDCIGLKFAGGQAFLYGAQKIYGSTASFSVPLGGYSVKVTIFENPTPGIKDQASQAKFTESMKASFTKTPGTAVLQEKIMDINAVPVLFLETASGKNMARNYFFNNRGRWVQITLSFTKESYARNPSGMNNFLKSVVLY